MQTPFMKPMTDGTEKHFWTVSLSGYAANALDFNTMPEVVKVMDFKLFNMFKQYHSIMILCTEGDLFIFDEYLSDIEGQHFKIIGLKPSTEEEVFYIVETLQFTSERWVEEVKSIKFLEV